MTEFPKTEAEQNQWYLRLIVNEVNRARSSTNPTDWLDALDTIQDYLFYVVNYEED